MSDKHKEVGLVVPTCHDENGEPSDIAVSYEDEAPRHKGAIVHNGTLHYPDEKPALIYGEEIFPLSFSVI